MDLHHLRLVTEICERGSIGKAAAALGISQPTLSKTVARLEDQLGQILFERGRGGSAAPTIFALHIAAQAREILAGSDRLMREVELLAGGEVGRVRIGVGIGVGALLLPNLLAEILDRFPHLHLDLDVIPSDDLYDRLAQRQFDLIVGHFSSMLNFSHMRVLPLFEEWGASIVRAGHPLTEVETLSWAESLSYPHVSLVKYKTYAPYFTEGLPAGAEQAFTTVRTSDRDCARALVADKNFVALASPLVFPAEMESNQFVTLALPRRYRSTCSIAVSEETAHFPVIREVMEIVRRDLSAYV